jgi:hypothetical protein
MECYRSRSPLLVAEQAPVRVRLNAPALSANTLHVTNGDSVLYVWKKAGLLGTHVAWLDNLFEGPVPAGLPLEATSRLRAAYLARRGYGNAIKINHDFEKRDAAIRNARSYDDVVLWFEHDLYDQLQLLHVLAALRDTDGTGAPVEIVQSDNYLGMLTADEIMALYPKRRYVTAAIEEGAARCWAAFTSSDPAALREAASSQYPGLPFLADALRRLCEEYPAAASGLSRSQKQLLEACAHGAQRKEDLFRRSQAREEAAFLGDSACYAILADLSADPAPLVASLENGYDITLLGRRVLAGDADWLEYQPLDRWIGGVHLQSDRHWRWDDAARQFVLRERGQG